MRLLLALATVAVALVAAGSQAQAPPSPEATVLYIHSEDGLLGTMDTQPEGGVTPFCNAAGTASPLGTLCTSVNGAFTYTILLDPPLVQGVLLDGTVDVAIYWGGNCCTVGTAAATLTLAMGETVIATGDATHRMNPAAANTGSTYNLLSASLPLSTDRIEAGGDLTFTISGTGTWTHAAISTAADRGQSTVTLPIVGLIEATDGNETDPGEDPPAPEAPEPDPEPSPTPGAGTGGSGDGGPQDHPTGGHEDPASQANGNPAQDAHDGHDHDESLAARLGDGYLPLSLLAVAAVVLVCIFALAVRWTP